MLGRGASWAGSVTFVSHGTIIAVRSTDVNVLEKVSAGLPTGAYLSEESEADAVYSWEVERPRSLHPVHVITMRCRRYLKGKDIARTTDVEKALAVLNHDAEFRVAMYAPDDVFVHAAAVAWQGRTVLLPGHSFAGKSTLVAELVRQGAPYYSDEYAVLDPTGSVRPFSRRLMLRSERGKVSARLSAEELGGTRGAGALPVGCVAVTRYSVGARWDPRPMTRGEMALALLGHAIDVQARPTQVLERIVRALGPDVVGLQGDRGEAVAAAREILDCLAQRPVAPTALSRSA